MKPYLTGIKSYQLDLGIDCKVCPNSLLEGTIHGIKQDHDEPNCRKRTPLTSPLILQILCCITPTSYENLVIWAVFRFPFAGFLHLGEFTYNEADRELGPSFSK